MYSGLGDPGRWVPPDVLNETALATPDAPWLADTYGRTMTFAEAECRSRRAASYFSALGVQRGERVGIFMLNGSDFVCAWLGLGKLAAASVLFNTELRGQFLRHQITDSGIACLLIDAGLLPALAKLAGELPDLATVVLAGTIPGGLPAAWRVVPWQDHAAASEWDGPGAAFSDIACVMNTSGTTGPAKGMLMPHAHCTLFGIGSIRCLALTSEDRFYVSLPFSTPTGC